MVNIGGVFVKKLETGTDLPPELIERMSAVMLDKIRLSDPNEEAQLRELSFWRWVAYEGYAGRQPMEFLEHQRKFMTSCFLMTGWNIDHFKWSQIFELGCGPLGMIEFVPAASKIAYDPLNSHFDKLFCNLRSDDIRYISSPLDLEVLPSVDFGICFNVLDHTNDAESWFSKFCEKIRIGGKFLLQVNTTRSDCQQSESHRRMHPSPVSVDLGMV